MDTRAPPSLPPPSEAYLEARRRAAGLDGKVPSPTPASRLEVAGEAGEVASDAPLFVALDRFRQSSFEGVAPGGSRPGRAEGERIVHLVEQLSGQSLVPAAAPPASTEEPTTAAAPPPPLEPQPSAKSAAVLAARVLLDAFEWGQVRELLLPYAHAADARARCALSECCLHLAEEALAKKDAAAKERAAECLEHASAAVEIDPSSARARVWYGQALQTRAKVLEGGMGQARVCGQMVLSWDRAVELAPDDPLAYHLLGSFAFHVCALPWVAAASMRQLAPGLRKFTADDARAYLEQSEARMGEPPSAGYALTNRSMLGRLLLGKGRKAEARGWLERALQVEAAAEAAGSSLRLDDAAREAAAEARKALKKC